MRKPRVFISHISEETELAQALKRHLISDFPGPLDVFVSSDGKTIQAGKQWLKELSAALEESQIEIILCSGESVDRPWVNFEAGAGWVRGIPVIPVCHSGMLPEALPLPLKMLQAVESSRREGLRDLYEAIAGALGRPAPQADFQAIARELETLEQSYLKVGHHVERIENPRILCAASEHYAKEANFDLDVAVLEEKFPGQVIVERQLTSRRLRDLLTTQKFQIAHLVVAVDADTGDLLFSPIDSTHKPTTPEVDKMTPQGFASLLPRSQTRLVVLATCYALYLAVEVAPLANMVATKVEVTGRQIAKWSECFYDFLSKGFPLFEAFRMTDELDGILPMKLIRQKDAAFFCHPRE